MPHTIEIAAFAFGAILILIAILGGNFKLFGSEISHSVSNRWLRFVSFILGVALLVVAVSLDTKKTDILSGGKAGIESGGRVELEGDEGKSQNNNQSTTTEQFQATDPPIKLEEEPLPGPKKLDVEWYSNKYEYAFHFDGEVGVATKSNSPSTYKKGDIILKVDYRDSGSFQGRAFSAGGYWHDVSGEFISENGELLMEGDGLTWVMTEQTASKMLSSHVTAMRSALPSQFSGEWYSPDYKFAFQFNEGLGITTQSNHPSTYEKGDVIIKVDFHDSNSFQGRAFHAGGFWNNISGKLISENNRLLMESGEYTWTMVKR